MAKKGDVIILCQYFFPENNSSATLPFDTACALAESGLTVSALCGMPKEYTEERNVPARETINGVKIHRLRYFQANREKKLGRLVNFLLFTVCVLLRIGEIARHRAVIVYSNPPVLPIVAAMANRLFRTKFLFVAYDIYPEIAVRMGSIRKGGLIDRTMISINRKVFRRASGIVVLSEQMRKELLLLRPELAEDRIHVVPNWAHEAAPKRASFDDKILRVGYFGNLGVVQDVETLIAAMERLRDDDRIRFLICGHGSGFDTVQRRAEKLPNVRVEGFLTGADLDRALGICDCCIVSLREGISGLCMPSKYYSYLQAGASVIAVIDSYSDLAREVLNERIGVSVPPGDVDGLCRALTDMAEDIASVHEAGTRAAAVYLDRYRRTQALDRYTAVMRSILEDT